MPLELERIGEGHPRDFVIMDNVERGPDSVECTPGLISTSARVWRHTDCFEDYSSLGRFAGFRCGCSCHDVLPRIAIEAAEAANVDLRELRSWWDDLTLEARQAFMTGAA